MSSASGSSDLCSSINESMQKSRAEYNMSSSNANGFGMSGANGGFGMSNGTHGTERSDKYGNGYDGRDGSTKLSSASNNNNDYDLDDKVEDTIDEEFINPLNASNVHSELHESSSSSVEKLTHQETKESAATDQFTKIEQEEQKTFTITG